MTVWQYLAIVLMAVNVLAGIFGNGETRKISAENRICDVFVWWLILYGGGFFK